LPIELLHGDPHFDKVIYPNQHPPPPDRFAAYDFRAYSTVIWALAPARLFASRLQNALDEYHSTYCPEVRIEGELPLSHSASPVDACVWPLRVDHAGAEYRSL